MDKTKPVPIHADVFWASLDTPNKLSNKYQVDLSNLSKEAVRELEAMGVTVKNEAKRPDQGFFVTAKSKNYPITAVDENGNLIKVKVANGSKCLALIKTYDASFQGKKGVGVGVSKLIVKELIEYKPEGVSLADLEEEAL